MKSVTIQSKRINAKPLEDVIILGGVWLFHVISNAIWLTLDQFPPTWDTAHHLMMTLDWQEFIQSPNVESLKIVAASAGSSYPPLPYLVVTPFYWLFGRSTDMAVLISGSLWLFVLLLATYGLGREVYNRKTGLLAAVIVSLYPLVVAMERDFFVDLQLTAVVALALWLLLFNGTFDHRGKAIALGLALGLGTLIKWPFSFFLFAPFLATLYEVHRKGGWSRNRFINVVICLAVAGTLAIAQYSFNLLFLPKGFYNSNTIVQMVSTISGAAGIPQWYSLRGLTYYVVTLVNHQATFFFAILFLASLPALFLKDVRGRLILILAIVVPYILATLLPLKEQRITMPYLSVFAVITALGITMIRPHRLRNVITVGVVLVGLLQWWAFSWGVSVLPPQVYWRTPWAHLAVFDQHYVRSPRDFSIQPENWKHLELIAAILSDANEQGIPLPTQVPIIANTAVYNRNTLDYISVLHDAKLKFLDVWNWMGDPLSLEYHPYSYLVWKNGENSYIPGWDKEDIETAEKYLLEHQDAFTLIYQAPLPDGTEILAYRRDVSK